MCKFYILFPFSSNIPFVRHEEKITVCLGISQWSIYLPAMITEFQALLPPSPPVQVKRQICLVSSLEFRPAELGGWDLCTVTILTLQGMVPSQSSWLLAEEEDGSGIKAWPKLPWKRLWD